MEGLPTEEFTLEAGARLVLDSEGLHLRRLPPAVEFGGAWDDLYAASVDRSDGALRVRVTFVDGLARLAEGRSSATATTFHLPRGAEHDPEALVASIERHRRTRIESSDQTKPSVQDSATPDKTEH